jgi:hypothetical protein
MYQCKWIGVNVERSRRWGCCWWVACGLLLAGVQTSRHLEPCRQCMGPCIAVPAWLPCRTVPPAPAMHVPLCLFIVPLYCASLLCLFVMLLYCASCTQVSWRVMRRAAAEAEAEGEGDGSRASPR